MAQYTEGTLSTTAASATVQGDVDVEWSTIPLGSWLTVDGDGASYQITGVTTDTLTLSAPFPTTKTDVNYVISQDFTPNRQLPLLNQGDQEAATFYNRAMGILDALAQSGWIYRGEVADATAMNAISDPVFGNYCWRIDENTHYFYTGSVWREWTVTGVSQGPQGAAGFTPEPDWVNNTQLRFTVQGGGYTAAVELKGDDGANGELRFVGEWDSGATYEDQEIVSDFSVALSRTIAYVANTQNTNFQPSLNPDKWDVFVDPGVGAGAGSAGAIRGTFTDASLDGNGDLTIAHTYSEAEVDVKMYYANGVQFEPDSVDISPGTSVIVGMLNFQPLSGTLSYIVTGVS